MIKLIMLHIHLKQRIAGLQNIMLPDIYYKDDIIDGSINKTESLSFTNIICITDIK